MNVANTQASTPKRFSSRSDSPWAGAARYLRPRLFSVLMAGSAFAGLSGCNAQQHVEHAGTDEGAREQTISARTVLTQLARHPRADDVAPELQRADSWLKSVESRLDDGDDDDPVVQLTLKAVQTEIAAIRSYFYRQEAEQALANVRARNAGEAEPTTTLDATEDPAAAPPELPIDDNYPADVPVPADVPAKERDEVSP